MTPKSPKNIDKISQRKFGDGLLLPRVIWSRKKQATNLATIKIAKVLSQERIQRKQLQSKIRKTGKSQKKNKKKLQN